MGPACPGTCNSTPYGGSGNETTNSVHMKSNHVTSTITEAMTTEYLSNVGSNLEPYLKSRDCQRVKKMLSMARSL